MTNLFNKGIRLLTVLAISATSFQITPAASAVSMGPVYNGTSGDVACTTDGQRSGFFTIVDNAVISQQDCAGSANIPYGVTSINEEAFYEDTLLSSVTISDSVQTIGKKAFKLTSSMQSVSFGSGVVSIGESAFEYAGDITSVDIPNNTTTIGAQAFYQLGALSSVTFGGRLRSIGDRAFTYSAITSLVIPNSVTSIGYFAFGANNSLTSLTLGTRVQEIGAFAFFNTDSLIEYSYCAALLTDEILVAAKLSTKTAFCDPNAPGDFVDESAESEPSDSGEEVTDAANAAASAIREAEQVSTRIEIMNSFQSAQSVDAQTFAKAGISGITESNISEVNAEILALPKEAQGELSQILKIARKYEVVGKISSESVDRILPITFIEVGLIPADSPNKAALANAVRNLFPGERDSYAEIKAAIEEEMVRIKDRADRLAAVLARRGSGEGN